MHRDLLQQAYSAMRHDPVSYTHLDVYKRQVFERLRNFMRTLRKHHMDGTDSGAANDATG